MESFCGRRKSYKCAVRRISWIRSARRVVSIWVGVSDRRVTCNEEKDHWCEAKGMFCGRFRTLNSKTEYRNLKQIRKKKLECFKRILPTDAALRWNAVLFLSLECVSDFDIRVSDLFNVFLRRAKPVVATLQPIPAKDLQRHKADCVHFVSHDITLDPRVRSNWPTYPP